MLEIKKITLIISIGVPLILFFIIFFSIICGESSAGSDNVTIVTKEDFGVPFEDNTVFHLSSPFGYRKDPFGSGVTKFHGGIDLGTSAGTNVLASANGIVYEVGYNPKGLGNYVYIKHETNDGVLYTAYGHMLDNSIVVETNQPISKRQKIGEVGSTGSSTAPHLHFMIMKNKISFNYEDLIDPYFVIYGLN